MLSRKGGKQALTYLDLAHICSLAFTIQNDVLIWALIDASRILKVWCVKFLYKRMLLILRTWIQGLQKSMANVQRKVSLYAVRFHHHQHAKSTWEDIKWILNSSNLNKFMIEYLICIFTNYRLSLIFLALNFLAIDYLSYQITYIKTKIPL